MSLTSKLLNEYLSGIRNVIDVVVIITKIMKSINKI